MPFGYSCHKIPLAHLKITVFRFLIVVHCSTKFHGRKAAYMTDYVIKHYGKAVVVFNGYENGPSTKDNAHIWRARAQMTEEHFTGSVIVSMKTNAFLSNMNNKQPFIKHLSSVLEQNG